MKVVSMGQPTVQFLGIEEPKAAEYTFKLLPTKASIKHLAMKDVPARCISYFGAK